MTTGVVTTVSPSRRGDTLAADTTITDTLLLVEDAGDFAEDDDFLTGDRWLVIGESEPLQYVDSDMDADTLTLAAPVGVVYEAGTPVYLWDETVQPAGAVAVEYLAHVELSDNSGVVPALVPHELIPLAGVDNLNGAAVEIVETAPQQWQVSAVYGREPTIDGTTIDPATLPSSTAPIPDDSPVPQPLVGPASVVVNYTPTPDEWVDLYVWVPPELAEGQTEYATPVGVTPDPSTLHTEHFPPGGFIYADANDTPLPAETPVWVALWAATESGAAPAPSTWVESAAGQIEPAFMQLLAGTVIAQRLQGETVQGVDLVGVTLEIPDAISAAPNYLSIQADVLEAQSGIFADNVTRRGTNNYLEGRETASGGITTPGTPPSVTASWPSRSTLVASTAEGAVLCHGPDAMYGDFVTVVDAFGDLDRSQLGTIGTTAPIKIADLSDVDGYLDPRGITLVGGEYWVLCANDALTDYYAINFTADFDPALGNAKQANEGIRLTGAIHVVGRKWVNGSPTIGTDGTNLLFAYQNSAGDIRISQCLPSDTNAPAYSTLPDSGGLDNRLVGMGVDSLGRLWIQPASGARVTWDDTTTPVRQASLDMPAPHGREVVAAWDGSDYYHTIDVDEVLYDQVIANEDLITDWGYTWYDSDAGGLGTAESLLSPIAGIPTLPNGASVLVKTPLPPDDGTTDAANTVRVYARQSDGTMQRQRTYAESELGTGYVFENVNLGALPPATSGFAERPSQVPGGYASDAGDAAGPYWELLGSGSGRAGPLSWDALGNATTIPAPAGTVVMFAGATAPPGWLLCDGQMVSRTTYPRLYAVIGHTYRADPGLDSFYLPDLRRRFPMGASSAVADSVLGSDDTQLDVQLRTPRHDHGIPGQPYGSGPLRGSGSAAGELVSRNAYDGHNHGGSTHMAHQLETSNPDRQFPYQALNFIIKT